jgi:hypothetical protein
MAVRLDKNHQDRTRAKIKVSQLVNRLQGCAEGRVEMTPAQMKAAEILLKKALPDLSQVEQHNTGDQKTYLVQVPQGTEDPKAWEKRAQEVTQKKAH